ncbi:hypothetical protein D3C86_1223590 [compost metagenome]
MLQMPGGGGGHLAAGRHGAGERDLGHFGVVDQKRAGVAVALDDVEQALWQAGFDEDFGNLQRAERRVFRGLEDHGIAGDQRGRGLPAGDLLRIVPGADADADAERHTLGIGEIASERDVIAVQCRRRDTAEKFEGIRAGCRIGDDGFLNGLARIQCLQRGKRIVAFAHDIGGAFEDAAARHRAHRRPFLLRAFGRGDGALDDGRCCRMQPCDHFAGGREDALERCAGIILDIVPVDEMRGFRLRLERRGDGHVEVSLRTRMDGFGRCPSGKDLSCMSK